jgi:hypothetical protein
VDLVRGRAPVAVEPCGPDGLVAISGIVPDGVATAFLVGRDGSAVRADVRDNGFAFLVRPERRRRWVVWTDPSGVPRVQPVALPAAPCPRRGAPAGLVGPPRVTPAPACLAAPPRPPRRPGRRGAPTPAPVAPSCGVLLQPLAP